MIKANELRIGNLVSNDHSTCEILHLNGGDFINCTLKTKQCNPIDAHYDSIKPIPLTEELLLNFGFKKDKYVMSDLIYFEKGDITIDLNPDGIFKLHIGTVFIKNIHFAHKLQNFFFEYEGSELVFSTEP